MLSIAKITGKYAAGDARDGGKARCGNRELFDGRVARRKRKKRIKRISAVNHKVPGESAAEPADQPGLLLEAARYQLAHASCAAQLAGGCAPQVQAAAHDAVHQHPHNRRLLVEGSSQAQPAATGGHRCLVDRIQILINIPSSQNHQFDLYLRLCLYQIANPRYGIAYYQGTQLRPTLHHSPALLRGS